jgi:hypothetical protein
MVGGIFAGENKFSGYMFGDYYWAAANHDTLVENSNGFRFRRIYFTYDRALNEDFSVRFRLEMNSRGDFMSTTKVLAINVKDAYLKWKYNNQSIYLGISPTPTWERIEKIWGYRSVEKTPLDLQKYGSSRGFGISFRGNLDKNRILSYHIMIANRRSIKNQINQGVKVFFSLAAKITKNIVVEGYGDYEPQPEHSDVYTAQGFAAYRGANIRFGVQYAHQERQIIATEEEVVLRLASVFAAGKIGEKIGWYLRTDRYFDPNPIGDLLPYLRFDSNSKSTFFLAGIDYAVVGAVHIMPNMEVIYYDKVNGVRADTDIMPRITFNYIW